MSDTSYYNLNHTTTDVSIIPAVCHHCGGRQGYPAELSTECPHDFHPQRLVAEVVVDYTAFGTDSEGAFQCLIQDAPQHYQYALAVMFTPEEAARLSSGRTRLELRLVAVGGCQ